MKREDYKQVKKIFQSALDIAPESRADYLDKKCSGNAAIRREVEKLLDSYKSDYLEQSAVEKFAETINSSNLSAGQEIGHYKIVKKIGAGGMGEVFLAEDAHLKRKIALKILPAALSQDKNYLRRFEQEACAASALNHPNILTVHEFGAENGTSFIASEFVEGKTLRERLGGEQFSLPETLDIAMQVAAALSAAHEAGIIHRDIKPENVMIREADGLVKVLDFGLAKLTLKQNEVIVTEGKTPLKTAPGIIMGTTAYMSPEQARGLQTDARSDIWSLGVVLYEMLAGKPPFQGETTSDTVASILMREPAPLESETNKTPSELQTIIRKTLSKDKDARYQTMKGLLADLKDLKDRISFAEKLERSESPEKISQAQQTLIEETKTTNETANVPTAPDADYLFNKIKSHQRRVTPALAAIVLITISAFAYFNYFRKKDAPVLTDKDVILITNFENKTGDEVFDGMLKQALATQLQQSPFLSIFSDEQARSVLKLMNRSADERITKTIGKEICQRQGLKALIAGAIAPLGSNYVLTLEAVNSQTGETFALVQTKAAGREQILESLSQAATELRGKLGESLASIQKFDKPLEEVTTSSLEAFKAYSMGLEQRYLGKNTESIPFFKRALEIDPNFASAYVQMYEAYGNTLQHELMIEAIIKAYELREKVSELEKLRINYLYYYAVTREVDKQIEALEIMKQMYPRDWRTRIYLALRYRGIGQREKSLEEAVEALRLNPNTFQPYRDLADAYIALNRFDEAREIIEKALRQNFDDAMFYQRLYVIASINNDGEEMQRQLNLMKGKTEESRINNWQAAEAIFRGQWRKSKEFSRRGFSLDLQKGLKDPAVGNLAIKAFRAAAIGQCKEAKSFASDALAYHSEMEKTIIINALAICGEVFQAQTLIDEYAKAHAQSTFINENWLPVIKALLLAQKGKKEKAAELLKQPQRFEYADIYINYLRALAYLKTNLRAEAEAEFQDILDHRGEASLAIAYPLSQLGKARATGNREDYEKFFEMWKDADTDLPILIEAKKEFQTLKAKNG